MVKSIKLFHGNDVMDTLNFIQHFYYLLSSLSSLLYSLFFFSSISVFSVYSSFLSKFLTSLLAISPPSLSNHFLFSFFSSLSSFLLLSSLLSILPFLFSHHSSTLPFLLFSLSSPLSPSFLLSSLISLSSSLLRRGVLSHLWRPDIRFAGSRSSHNYSLAQFRVFMALLIESQWKPGRVNCKDGCKRIINELSVRHPLQTKGSP